MYRRGAIVSPVWPTCAERSIQPSSQATRVAPTAPLSSCASERTRSKSPSTPRPPTTTVRACASCGPAAASSSVWLTTSTRLAAWLTLTARVSTWAAAPPQGSASTAPARRHTSGGLAPESARRSKVVFQEPESTSLEARTCWSTTSRQAASAMQALASLTAARPAISLARWSLPSKIRAGLTSWAAAITASAPAAETSSSAPA